MKTVIALAASAFMLTGCYGTRFYFASRSNFSTTDQTATTSGRTDSRPSARDQSVAAEKTTDIKAQVPEPEPAPAPAAK